MKDEKYESPIGWVCSRLRTEVAAVAETGDDGAVGADHVDDALLDEVHLVPQSALAHHQVARLEHLEVQPAHHLSDELGVRVREEGHRRHQRPAIEVDHLLHAQRAVRKENVILILVMNQ